MSSQNLYYFNPSYYYYELPAYLHDVHYHPQYLQHNPQYLHYNPDVINTPTSTQLHNFVDPATSISPILADSATGTAFMVTTKNPCDKHEEHRQEYYHMEPTNGSNVMTNNVETKVTTQCNHIGETQHAYHQMQSPSASSTNGQSNDDRIDGSNSFGDVQYESNYHQIGSSSSSTLNNGQSCDDVTNDVTYGKVQKVQLSSPTNRGNNANVSAVTAEKVQNENLFCVPCARGFKAMSYFKQHNDAIHNPAKQHKCKKCHKRFATEDECNEHYEKHFGKKPFSCEDCNKSFHYKSDLRRHSRRHTMELFCCSICGKGFSRQTHQEAHEKTHLRIKNTGNANGKKL